MTARGLADLKVQHPSFPSPSHGSKNDIFPPDRLQAASGPMTEYRMHVLLFPPAHISTLHLLLILLLSSSLSF